MEELFKSIKIGNLKIKNRIAMSPMNATLSTQDGYVTNANLAWHARRAKGGFGLIITDAILCTELSAPFVWGRNLYLYNDSYIAGLNRLVETVHRFGAKIIAQLSIGFGRQGHSIDGTKPYAPSAIPYEIPKEMMPNLFKGIEDKSFLDRVLKIEIPREMTIEEIKSEIIAYGKACQRALQAGFDGIEIHAPHGYLEHEFLSPRSNKRTDLYGGNLQNRMRFLVEVCEEAIDAVHGGIPVGIRMSCAEHMPEGFTLDDVIVVAKKMQDLGISYFNVSDGSYEAQKYMLPESIEHVQNHLLKEVKRLKEVLEIPIITPSIHDPLVAEGAIKDGITDIISLGRQAIADPDWPNKVKEGKLDEIKRCRRCSLCLHRCFSGLFPSCTINPEAGFEEYNMDLFPNKRYDPMFPSTLIKLITSFRKKN
jgi:2,4-dienoyl-CoA reductase-like NADH-dependent reductase (Old Yellow Enzyme family)